MVQIRNMPEPLHRRLKARAALAGKSISDYLLVEIRQILDQPTIEELKARLAKQPPAPPGLSPTELLRAERDSR
jgi:plasmid stability protein